MFTTLFMFLLVHNAWLVQCHRDPEHFELYTHNLDLTMVDGDILADLAVCQVLSVESMPVNLTYTPASPKFASTYHAWNFLIRQAKSRLNIASFYWSLVAESVYNASSVEPGSHIFDQLVKKASQVNLSIEQSGTKKSDSELEKLVSSGANVYWIDVAGMLGQGVLHTKLWTADRKHAYVGSANMDWRSLTQVKELGALFINCPALVDDLDKIHKAYQLVSRGIPKSWPSDLNTAYNMTNPMHLTINGLASRVYFSGSPASFNAPGRTNDIDAILDVIRRAEKFIYISVMDYSAEVVNYGRKNGPGEYWPVIDNALKTAAINRGVEVRLLISHWPYSSKSIPKYLESLRALNGIHGAPIRVRYFVVPVMTEDQKIIPHARVNHNKYMVTDKTAYIGTSNWSGDYFAYTGGVGFVCEQDPVEPGQAQQLDPPQTIRSNLVAIFLRDWNSEHAFEQWD